MTDDNEAIAERLESERALLLNIDALRGGVDLLADTVRLETGTLHRRVDDLVARMGQFEKFALRLIKVIDAFERDKTQGDWWREGTTEGPDGELTE
jgi:hypothetical protein